MEQQQKLIIELKSFHRQRQELEDILKTKSPQDGNTLNFSYFQIKRKTKEISKDIERIQSFLTPNITA